MATPRNPKNWFVIFSGALVLLTGCTAVPKGVTPVTGFDGPRYTGKWYEVARLDHSFERGLTRVTAEYTLNSNGSVTVVNRGWDARGQRWKEVRGRAKFRGDQSVGSLQVSFFGPFYGGYHVLALDKNGYGYSMVCGPTRSYLWILARQPTLDDAVRTALVEQARELGFAVDQLIWVDQN
ncbi:MAG: Outer membrane lipoprotein Blc [Verrucomicrobiae bacterium]|nr:Outer membrane lipoprotein Blc [Verrucomicrobiae bacterium]